MGEKSVSDQTNLDFLAKRDAAKDRINRIDRAVLVDNPRREAFFETVYDKADGDAAGVPWADLAAKDKLAEWISSQSGHTGRAMDVGCGLGDNAEALSEAGYATTAFDFSAKAIEWARKRFIDTDVEYHVANLFELPEDWKAAFDLVHECYTLQSIPPETLSQSVPAVAGLVAPGGTLLIYSRLVEDGVETQGPPWPLQRSMLRSFEHLGLELVESQEFDLVRPDKTIAHQFSVWQRSK